MCGILGFFETGQKADRSQMQAMGQAMLDTIRHRGPDGEGLWQDPDVPVLLGHRRLAIIDLTDDGAQPMVSQSERYVISYNGEVYNFPVLQKELEGAGVRFRGRSDTEVMLAAIDHWGLNVALQKFDGMFAFALWDRKEKSLHLVRDRMGKKPLYVGRVGGSLCFASELKALAVYPAFEKKVNRQALALFMRYGSVPAPYSIYEGVWQLLPGCRITLDVGALQEGADMAALMEPYWHMPRIVEEARQKGFFGNADDAVKVFHDLLMQAVRERMVSDVPLGAFLSGGIDSSTVVAMMQELSSGSVKTFSIGFKEQGFDEVVYAKKVAQHLGTEHHELYLEPEDALDVIPMLPDMYDEPFADVSQIPTYLVSRFAQENVTVTLSGDGGDEMLGGYNRHFVLPALWRRVGWMPQGMRYAFGNIMEGIATERWDSAVKKHPQFGDRMHKIARLLKAPDAEAAYLALLQQGQGVENLVLGAEGDPVIPLTDPAWQAQGLFLTERMLYGDALSYLPNDVLTKVDRASMAVSLEVRAPLLDRRLFEYCWSLPENMKIRNGKGKWLLRETLSRYVPRDLYERPKQGFGVPVGAWLRGPLKDWAEDLLSEKSLQEGGYLDAAKIRKLWEAHNKGEGSHGSVLWSALMFQSWQARWL